MQEETAGMNDDEEDLDSAIHHAKALTWVFVALFMVTLSALRPLARMIRGSSWGPLAGPRPSWASSGLVCGGPP